MLEIRRPPLATAISSYEFVVAALIAINVLVLISFYLLGPGVRVQMHPPRGLAMAAAKVALAVLAGAMLLQMHKHAIYPFAVKLALSLYSFLAEVHFRLAHPQFIPLQHMRMHSPTLTFLSLALRYGLLLDVAFLLLNTAITLYVFRITRHSDTPDRAAIQPQSPAAF